MAKWTRTLTVFGNDLDVLLKRAGISSIREYADECRVSYKYISQLRTSPERRPGRLYTDLLKPFTRLKIIGLVEAHQMSLRHRGKRLSLTECKSLFPDVPEREMLESIKLAVEVRRHAGPQAPQEQPTSEKSKPQTAGPGEQASPYRRVFVGRERELAKLRAAFADVAAGKGALMMLVGEPGIGKTALCEHFANYVESRGGLALIGHCYSERTMSLPYLAFVEALRSEVNSRDRAELRAQLGKVSADLARIVPEIKDKLRVRLRPRGDPEEERYRLMESVAYFLGNIAAVRPVLLVLEDLHNADKGTLDMLIHLSRSVSDARLLVVGTYRDVEVDRTHPLAAALAELRRVPSFRRVLLRGLNADEVNRMCSTITDREMPRRLADAICMQTEGNPLFVQEVIRYLAEEGLISSKSEIGQTSGGPYEMKIPDGLRDVIGRRLSRLSESCNRVLAVAAVIGREFPLDVLQRVASIPDEELFTALEEAVSAAVIEESATVPTAVNYRFAHAFFRQTLYEEIIAPKRIRLHQRTARVLEEAHSRRLDEHAASLAEHFSHSSDPVDLSRAVSYGEMAAERAASVYAYGEAVRSLEQALKVQEILSSDDPVRRCDLLLALGEALCVSGQAKRAVEVELSEAFSLAVASGDSLRASRASALAMIGLTYHVGGRLWTIPDFARWAERAYRYSEPGSEARALADHGLGLAKTAAGISTGQQPLIAEGYRLIRQACEISSRLDDGATFWFVAYRMLGSGPPQLTEERWRLAEELAARSRDRVPAKNLSMSLWFLGWVFMESGKRQRADEIWEEIKALGERTSQPHAVLVAMAHEANIANLDGRFEDSAEIIQRLQARGEELGLSEFAISAAAAGNFLDMLRMFYWDDQEVGRHLSLLWGSWSPPRRAAFLARLGRDAEVIEILGQRVIARPLFGSAEDYTPVSDDIFYLQAAVAVKHREAVTMLLDRLAGVRLVCAQGVGCVSQWLGEAAAFLVRHEEARAYYREAMKTNTDMRIRPGLALTRLGLAELLLDHYPDERKEAMEHLEFAIKEFRGMKMQPSLERALRRKRTLKE